MNVQSGKTAEELDLLTDETSLSLSLSLSLTNPSLELTHPQCPIVALVIPCYNEKDALPLSAPVFANALNELISSKQVSEKSFIMFCDDGSKDNTWQIISELHENNQIFRGLKLAHNKGHQNVLYAGLMAVKDVADISISMDVDLQDDINIIGEMISSYKAGNDIVYGVRSSRKTDSFFKRFTAETFYKVMSKLGTKTIYNHADFRLMSRKALLALSEYGEVNLFLRGIAVDIGLEHSAVEYERAERVGGESKYPLRKMLSFAWQGITSFSTKPLRLVLFFGIISAFISGFIIIYSLVRYFMGEVISGWTSTILSIWVVASFQFIAIAIVAEYIGKIYQESKRRPRYFVDKII